MYAPKFTVLLAASHLGQVFATPMPVEAALIISPGHELLKTVQVKEGILEYYGYKTEAEALAADAKLSKRQCGSNSITCTNTNVANVGACNSLISALQSNPNQGLGSTQRDICLNTNGRCCVSWANNVNGLTQGNLINAAQQSLGRCQSGGVVSARSSNTLLASTCTIQCLSNRPDGC